MFTKVNNSGIAFSKMFVLSLYFIKKAKINSPGQSFC